jgi:hypothetical protein
MDQGLVGGHEGLEEPGITGLKSDLDDLRLAD